MIKWTETSSYGLNRRAKTLLFKATSEEQINNCFELAHNSKLAITPKGSGNSFGDIFFSEGNICLDVSKLNEILFYDCSEGIIEAQAGTRICDLLARTLPDNWILTGLSGSITDTLAGMVSSNSHGKDSWKNGNFRNNIISIRVKLANGEVAEVLNHADSLLFNSIVGGLGIIAIILSVKFKLRKTPSSFICAETTFCKNQDAIEQKFNNLSNDNPDYAYAFVDTFSKNSLLGRGVWRKATYIDQPKLKHQKLLRSLSVPDKIYGVSPDLFWSLFRVFNGNLFMKSFNALICIHSKRGTKQNLLFADYQYAHGRFPKANHMFLPNGFIEIQCLFPLISHRSAVEELLSYCHATEHFPWLCSMKKLTPDESYLSFAGNGITIALTFSLNYFAGIKSDVFLKTLLDKVMKHKGKVYLAKYPFLLPEILKEMYPAYNSFMQVKKKYDPNNFFRSNAAERLGLLA